MENSGILILLGETQHVTWLPFGSAQNNYPTTIKIPAGKQNDSIFLGLTAKKLKYHASYTAHGTLLTPPEASGVEKLIEDKGGDVLMSRWQQPGGGWVLATTLDADHHAAEATPGPGSKQKNTTVQRNARKLLKNIVVWAERESKELTSFWRKLALYRFALRA